MSESSMLPPQVECYLRTLFMQRARPLLLSFDADWKLRDVQGDVSHFGIDVADRGVRELQDLFIGLPLHDDLDIPFVELSSGRSAHVHLIADSDGFHVLLLDAEDERTRQRAQQQLGNEALLAGHAKSKAIGRLQDIRSELERQRAALEEANALKNALIATLGHEFRTPLTSIFGYVQMLDRRFGAGANVAQALNAIRRNAIHLFMLAENLLQYGRGESAALLNPVEIDLSVIAGDLEAMFRAAAEDRKLALAIRVECDDAALVLDEMRLRQILVNLISNAVRHTAHGEIAVELRWRDASFRLEVRDSGVGIAAQFHESIFKPFNNGAQNGSKGAGLGLYIVRRLVEQMRGELQFESKIGQGTRVVVALNSHELAAVTGDATKWCFRGGEVLVVDDDPDIAHLLEALLLDLGLRVRIAENAADAIEAATSHPPDLLLIDVELPGLSGNAAVFQLRSRGYRGRIVTLSASSTQQAHDAALRAGADHYMTKPLDIEQLVSVMQRALGNR